MTLEPDHGEELLPEEEASRGAVDAAALFFLAVSRGDAAALWGMLSEDARAYVLNVAVERGMDFDLASRIRVGTAGRADMEDYLRQLVEGIRRDLRGVDPSRLVFDSTAEPHAPMRVRVRYLVELPGGTLGAGAAIPAGSVLLVYEDERWKIDRLIPRPGGGA